MAVQIEKESQNKIKITLKPVDLQKMNVSVESLKPDSPQLHNFLHEIMERVQEETGFNPYSGKIMVEAMPMGENMLLTVTRISVQNKISIGEKPKKIRAVANKTYHRHTAFSFNSFENFCKALTSLNSETVKNSDYYILDKSNVLLVGSLSDSERYLLNEFSDVSKCNGIFDSYLKEHAKHISGGETLVNMAEGIKRINS